MCRTFSVKENMHVNNSSKFSRNSKVGDGQFPLTYSGSCTNSMEVVTIIHSLQRVNYIFCLNLRLAF